MLWDKLLMAMVRLIWTERNNRIFNHKVASTIDLLDSVLYFVDFLKGLLPIPKKCKVDSSLLAYATKKCKGPSDGSRACDSSCSALVPVGVCGIVVGISRWWFLMVL